MILDGPRQEGWLLLDGVSSVPPPPLLSPAPALLLSAFLLRVCVFICVVLWCVYVVYELLCMCMDARAGHQMPSVILRFIPSRQRLSLNTELCFSARLAIGQPQQSSCLHPSLPPQCWSSGCKDTMPILGTVTHTHVLMVTQQVFITMKSYLQLQFPALDGQLRH